MSKRLNDFPPSTCVLRECLHVSKDKSMPRCTSASSGFPSKANCTYDSREPRRDRTRKSYVCESMATSNAFTASPRHKIG